MRTLITIFFTITFFISLAQDIEVEDRYKEWYGPKPAFHLSFRNVLFSDDYLMGVEGGMITASRDFTLFASLDFRPYRKKVLNYQGGNLFYQNTEERYFFGVGGEYHKYLKEKKYGGFVQLNAAYTWGEYGGTEINPPRGWVVVPRVGAFWKMTRHLYLKGGYAYVDTKNDEIGKHRLYLALSGILVR